MCYADEVAQSGYQRVNPLGGQECRDCGTTQTPLWRQYLEVTYCNACGLRRKRADGAYVRTTKPSR